MAQTVTIKRRISSVKNTRQITKAMELVAASKMRKAQEAVAVSRLYRNTARSILRKLYNHPALALSPLHSSRKIRRRTYVLVTSDRGLAGAFNGNMLRSFLRKVQADIKQNIAVSVIVVGKKGAQFLVKLPDVETIAVFEELSADFSPEAVRPIVNLMLRRFVDNQTDEVVLLYTDYKSSLQQIVTSQAVLPVRYAIDQVSDAAGADNTEAIDHAADWPLLEPSAAAIIDDASRRLVEVDTWRALLESYASEQASRMMAMKTASDNAADIIDDLTLAMNTARQAAITQELAEITGGAEAIQ